MSTGVARVNPATPGASTCLDLRGLPAPEPLERALAAAAELSPGEELQVLTPMMPFPLLQLLSARGFEAAAELLPGGQARVRVRRSAAP